MKKTFFFLVGTPLTFEGESMEPLLYARDRVWSKKTVFSKITVNDLILVKKGNEIFVHRVIFRSKGYLVTKGDNNLKSDGKILPRHVIGQVAKVKRKNNIINPETIYLLQSTFYFNEIIAIADDFAGAKVNYVFLKGLPLHLYIEKTHPQRIYQDADILVDREDYLMAQKILKKHGYKKLDTSLFSKESGKIAPEISYYKVKNGFPVIFDVHLEVVFMMTQVNGIEALYPKKLLNLMTKEFLDTKKRVIVLGKSFPILDDPHLVVYLALHFFHHNFRGIFRLEFFHKAALYAQKKGSNALLSCLPIIAKYKLSNFTGPVFHLSQKHFSTALPGPLRKEGMTLKKINVFDDQTRFEAGVERFSNLFHLSPNPIWVKMWVFLNPEVILTLGRILKAKLSSSLKTLSGNQ